MSGIEIFLIALFVLVIILLFVFIFNISSTNMKKTFKKNIEMQNEILKENKDLLKENANLQADITKDAIEEVMNSVKKGLDKDE